MLNDAWYDIRNSVIETWYLHSTAIIAAAMILTVLYLVYLWRSERV